MAQIKAKVLYDFEAQAPGEISIREGDTVTVTSRDVGEGWCEGINAKGELRMMHNLNHLSLIPVGTCNYPF